MQESIRQIGNSLKEEYNVLQGELSEKGRRKWAGFPAQRLGHGGKTLVHRATGLDYNILYKPIERPLKEEIRALAMPSFLRSTIRSKNFRSRQQHPQLVG